MPQVFLRSLAPQTHTERAHTSKHTNLSPSSSHDSRAGTAAPPKGWSDTRPQAGCCPGVGRLNGLKSSFPAGFRSGLVPGTRFLGVVYYFSGGVGDAWPSELVEKVTGAGDQDISARLAIFGPALHLVCAFSICWANAKDRRGLAG